MWASTLISAVNIHHRNGNGSGQQSKAYTLLLTSPRQQPRQPGLALLDADSRTPRKGEDTKRNRSETNTADDAEL